MAEHAFAAPRRLAAADCECAQLTVRVHTSLLVGQYSTTSEELYAALRIVDLGFIADAVPAVFSKKGALHKDLLAQLILDYESGLSIEVCSWHRCGAGVGGADGLGRGALIACRLARRLPIHRVSSPPPAGRHTARAHEDGGLARAGAAGLLRHEPHWRPASCAACRCGSGRQARLAAAGEKAGSGRSRPGRRGARPASVRGTTQLSRERRATAATGLPSHGLVGTPRLSESPLLSHSALPLPSSPCLPTCSS